jgi:hypothetical protein
LENRCGRGGRESTIDRVEADTFVRDGYVAVRGAFDERIAGACRDMIWDSLGVHTATWPHRGTSPPMMAQPGIEVPGGFALDGSDRSPVARAIVEGLARAS